MPKSGGSVVTYIYHMLHLELLRKSWHLNPQILLGYQPIYVLTSSKKKISKD